MRCGKRRMSFDSVESMREIRNQISNEIAAMSYAELSRWLDKGVRENSVFARMPITRRSARPPMERTGAAGDQLRPLSTGARAR